MPAKGRGSGAPKHGDAKQADPGLARSRLGIGAPPAPDDAEGILSKGLSQLAQGEHARVGATLAELCATVGDDDARPHMLRAELAWDLDGPEAALPHLRRAVQIDRDDPDARHRLALAYEALGDLESMRREFLQARALDAEGDRALGLGSPEELDFISEVAAEVIAALPASFSKRLAHVPVVLEPRPSLRLVREGFDPRAFGLFEGPGQLDAAVAVESPTRIVLYTANLLAEFVDPDELAEQIEITVLHEIGHYFGLEEHDMERLGLD